MDLETISHYKIIRTIGSGGMGEVYLAEDTRLKRKVALKMLPIDAEADASKIARFEKEARAASALSHPNILTVYDVGEVDSFRYIVTEYVDGQTLRDYFSHGRVPLQKALDIIIDVAKALSAAHDAGIVHRDIKPENIMIRKDGLVKVLDFGLAKLTEAETGENTLEVTAPGMIMGTPKYMSPEQVRGFEVDRRSDVFSLGIVFYEIAAGVPPFDGATVSDLIAAVLTREPAPLSGYKPEIPPAVQKIINRCLEKDIIARYQSMPRLIYDLGLCNSSTGSIAREQNVTLQMPAGSENATMPLNADPDAVETVQVSSSSLEAAAATQNIRKRKLYVAGAAAILLPSLIGVPLWLASGSGSTANVSTKSSSRIPVRVIDPLGGENEDDLNDLHASWEVAEDGLDPSGVADTRSPGNEEAALNVSADFLADRQAKALEDRPGEKGLRPPGLSVPAELFGDGVIKQKQQLLQMIGQGYRQPMDFADLAEKRLRRELIEMPMATNSFYLDIGGSAQDTPFTSFDFLDGNVEIGHDYRNPKYESLRRLAVNFAGQRYDLDDPFDRKQMRRRLLRMLHPRVKPVLQEVAGTYHDRFGRPLRVTALTRSMDYQLLLNAGDPNSFRVTGEGSLPPHSSGYAFDIARKHMPADEQNFVMQKLAEMERRGVHDALIEYGDSACFHVFVYPLPQR